MLYYTYFFAILCISTSLVYCTEPTTMIEAVIQNCSLSDSLIKDQFKSPPECKNWTDIKSIKEFSKKEDKYPIICLLYYESMISSCSKFTSVDEFILTSKEPEITLLHDVCSYLITKQSESHVVKDFIQTQEKCAVLCYSKLFKGKLISEPICTKSYNFFKFLENGQNQASRIEEPNAQNSLTISKEIPNNEDATLNNKQSVDDKPAAPTETSRTVINKEAQDKVEIHDMKNEQAAMSVEQNKPVEEQNQSVGEQNKPVEEQNQPVGEQNKPVEEHSKPVGEPNNPVVEQNKPITEQNKPVASNKASLKPAVVTKNGDNPEQIEKDGNTELNTNQDPALVDNQQAPPTNSIVSGQSTGQGQMYQDDDDIAYPPEKDEKPADVPVETAQETNDEEEDLTPSKFKNPEVSPLSEGFGYDDDLSGNSYFFSYFSFTCIVLVVGYVLYHNKQKVIALVVEGRHSRRPQRSRRPNSANYHKLDSNLEEAISSSVSKNPSHVIY